MSEAVNKLYFDVAAFYGLTLLQLRDKLVAGEPLVHRYYEAVYKWDSKTEQPPW